MTRIFKSVFRRLSPQAWVQVGFPSLREPQNQRILPFCGLVAEQSQVAWDNSTWHVFVCLRPCRCFLTRDASFRVVQQEENPTQVFLGHFSESGRQAGSLSKVRHGLIPRKSPVYVDDQQECCSPWSRKFLESATVSFPSLKTVWCMRPETDFPRFLHRWRWESACNVAWFTYLWCPARLHGAIRNWQCWEAFLLSNNLSSAPKYARLCTCRLLHRLGCLFLSGCRGGAMHVGLIHSSKTNPSISLFWIHFGEFGVSSPYPSFLSRYHVLLTDLRHRLLLIGSLHNFGSFLLIHNPSLFPPSWHLRLALLRPPASTPRTAMST